MSGEKAPGFSSGGALSAPIGRKGTIEAPAQRRGKSAKGKSSFAIPLGGRLPTNH